MTSEPQVGLADVSIRVGATGYPGTGGHRCDRECERKSSGDKGRPAHQRLDHSRSGAPHTPNRLTLNSATGNEVAGERDESDQERAIGVPRPDRKTEHAAVEASEQDQRSRPRRRRAGDPEQNGAHCLHERPLGSITRTGLGELLA
jgi:hypothetical protein